MRQLNSRAQGGGAFVGDKGVPHAIDGECHRRKVDDHLIGEAAPIGVAFTEDRERADATKRVPTHE